MLIMLLSSCATDRIDVQTSPGICDGLVQSIDELNDTTLRHVDDGIFIIKYGDVVLSITRVIKGFDAGCENG